MFRGNKAIRPAGLLQALSFGTGNPHMLTLNLCIMSSVVHPSSAWARPGLQSVAMLCLWCVCMRRVKR